MACIRKLAKAPVNQLVSRQFSVASRASAFLRLDPAPYEREVVDTGITGVLQKEKGPWKDLTKEEKLQRKSIRPFCDTDFSACMSILRLLCRLLHLS